MPQPLKIFGAPTAALLVAVGACSQDTGSGLGPGEQAALDGFSCSIPESEVFVGVP